MPCSTCRRPNCGGTCAARRSFIFPDGSARPLFVSVLLHGNEDSGWRAIQSVMRQHRGTPLPRPMLLFVGNVAAARAGVRTLPDQEDCNRAWPGTPNPETPLARLLANVVEIVRREQPFASIDIHNNTGRNPHYACVNSFDEAHLHLARLFSRTVVYFEEPVGVQSAALAPICPAVTVECGRAGRRDQRSACRGVRARGAGACSTSRTIACPTATST